MIREDYIMRMIRQLADALARITGLRTAGRPDDALEECDRTYDGLGVPGELVARLDTATLASMLRHAETMRAVAQVCCEEARIYEGKGDPMTAFARWRTAHELILEARAIDPQPEDDTRILELSRNVPASHLAARYRAT